MRLFSPPFAISTLALFPVLGWSIELNIDDQQSIKDAAKIAATKLRAIYPNKEPWFNPGEFGVMQTADGKNDKGYYWWEAGAAMGAWVDYWHYTGDDQFNAIVTEAMLHQVGPGLNYEPPNQTASLGNDDQAFWGIAALAAAERGFPDPPSDKPQWLSLAQAVFNRQSTRWDTETCNGGLRWQVIPANKGYDYKNSISNGLFFQIGARLARYTGNTTYSDWASKVYDWSKAQGLISDDYRVYDGAHIPECYVTSKIQWSYNAGVYLSGAAFLWNITSDPKWKTETEKLLAATNLFFFSTEPPNIMQEPACEFDRDGRGPTCNTDQRSFKAYLSRFLALTWHMAPFTQTEITTRLRTSASAAAKSCNGGADGQTCGLSWIKQTYDSAPYGIAAGGVGEHMAAMEIIQSNLLPWSEPPVTQADGGTSKGDYAAGTGSGGLNADSLRQTDPSTTGDKAGAGILTAIVLGALVGFTWWLLRN